MSKIPETTIDIVRDTADIVDIVSQYVDLKQRGANFLVYALFIAKKQHLLASLLQNRFIIALVVILEGMYFLLLWNIRKFLFQKQ